MSNDPGDWYRPTTLDDGEPAYWVTREGVIFYAMKTDGKVATQAQMEIATIVAAWYRGEILPRDAAPTVSMLLEFDKDAQAEWEQEQAQQQPEPLEIVGGVAGLQKLLVKMAEQNRGLDHAALKELIDTHELVMAVYPAKGELISPPGLGFRTLKGTEHLLAQIKQRRTKKAKATMTAVWCNNREHAELLQQAFAVSKGQ